MRPFALQVVSTPPSVVTASHLPAAGKSITFEIIKGGTITDPSTTYAYSTVTGGTVVAKTLVARADGQDTVSSGKAFTLDVGTYQVRATAYPNADGTGVAQGIGVTPLTVDATSNPPTPVTLNTTIYRIAVSSKSSGYEMSQGDTVQMIATAYNYGGSAVVTLPSQLTWTSSNPAVASVDTMSGAVTFVAPGSASFSATEVESGKIGTSFPFTVVGPPLPQFNPRDAAFVASSINGDLAAVDGHLYQFDTGASPAPTLTDTTTGQLVATGQYVTQSFEPERKSVTYALFDFTGNINVRAASQLKASGANPLVLLAQNNILMDGGALIDVSASGATPGARGGGPKSGPGAGKVVTVTIRYPYELRPRTQTYYGGGGFGGQGGGYSGAGGVTYGADLGTSPIPHLQGGSGGYTTGTATFIGGAGGGALYLAATGTIIINDAALKARGGEGATGGSGGGLALFGGAGVMLTQATLDVSGGSVTSAFSVYGGGGGGRVMVGYGAGATPDLSLVTVSGGAGYYGDNYRGGTGIVHAGSFGGF